VQKLRRLEQVIAGIHQLRALQVEGLHMDPALAKALDEEQRLRSWITNHEHRKP
jgi:hypothetical protein